MKFKIEIIELKEANSFIEKHHRTHKRIQGHRFSIGAYSDNKLVGVAVCGRPLSRHENPKKTLEITRLCTDGTPNVCSFLYSKCVRIAQIFGFEKIQTYITASENGASLKASGFQLVKPKCGNTKWSNKSNYTINLFGIENKYPNEKKKLFLRKLK